MKSTDLPLIVLPLKRSFFTPHWVVKFTIKYFFACVRITKKIALDCEMVGVGFDGKQHMLARVSIVNSHGHVVYDSFVAPQEKVIDYRTPISGVKPTDLKNGKLQDFIAF